MDVEKWIEDHHSGKRDEEVVLRGGKPWGFSLQGGCESHAPLTISKVDPHGKAAGQLYVGDTVVCVNGDSCRSLVQAVQRVQKTDYCLTLLINRGTLRESDTNVTNGKYSTTYQQDIVPDLDKRHLGGARGSAFTQLKTGPKSRKSDSFLIENPARPQSWHPPVNQREKVLPWQQQNTDQPQESSAMKSSHAPAMSWQSSIAPPTGLLSMKSYASYNNVYNLPASTLSSNLTSLQRHTMQDNMSHQPAVSSWGGLSNAKSVSSLPNSSNPQPMSPSLSKSGSVYANLRRESGIPFSPQSRGQDEQIRDDTDFQRLSSGSNSQRMDLKHSRSMGDMKNNTSHELHPPVIGKEYVKPDHQRHTSSGHQSPVSVASVSSSLGFKSISSDVSSVSTYRNPDDNEQPPAPPARDSSSLRYSGVMATSSQGHTRSPSWSVSSRDYNRSAGLDNNTNSIRAENSGNDNRLLSENFSSINDSRDHSSYGDKPRIKSWDCNPSQTLSSVQTDTQLFPRNVSNFGNQSSTYNMKMHDRPNSSQEQPYKTDTLHKAKVAKVCPSPDIKAHEQYSSSHGDAGYNSQRRLSAQSPGDSTSTHRYFSDSSPSDNASNGDARFRNLYMQSGNSFLKYDHDERQHADKNYNIPSPSERDQPNDKSKHHSREEKSLHLVNEISPSRSKLDDLLQRYAAEIKHDSEQLKNLNSTSDFQHQQFDSDISTPRHSTTSSELSAPWHSATSSMSSADSGPRASYSVVRSPKSFSAGHHQAQSQGTQHSSGYSYTARSKPFYNTATQTDSVSDEKQTAQGLHSSNLKNAEVQVDENFHSRNSSSSSQFSPSPHRLNSTQFSFNEEDVGQIQNSEPHSHHKESGAGHRNQRIPEMISEENTNKKQLNVTNDIIAPLNEYSSNEAPLLRKLSMEFYGSERFGGSYTRLDNIVRRDVPPIPEEKDTKNSYAKYPTAWSNKNYEDIRQAPVLHNADKFANNQGGRSYADKKNESIRNDLLSHGSDNYKMDKHLPISNDSRKDMSSALDKSNDQTNLTKNDERRQSKRRQSRGRLSESRNPDASNYEEIVWSNDANPMLTTLSSSDPPLHRNKQVSLKKAYGIFDEVEFYGEKRNLAKHGKSASVSHVSMHLSKDAKNAKHSQKSDQSSHSNSKDSKNYLDLKQTSQKLFGSTEDTRKNSQQKPQQPEKKLRRTSSEQFRPIKERLKSEENNHKKSDPDSKTENRQKTSDPVPSELQTALKIDTTRSLYNRRLSDPKVHHRYSESDDVFQKGQSRLQPSTDDRQIRSKSESGKHKNSDPELKKVQSQAVMSFFEMKTGKRLSGVSVTSDASSIIASDIGSVVSSDESSVLKDQSFEETIRNNVKREAMPKSRSMPRDLRLPSSDSNLSPDTKSSGVPFEQKVSPLADMSRPRSQSSGDSLSPGGSHRDHIWEFSKEKRRSASVGKDDSEWSMSATSTNLQKSQPTLNTAQGSAAVNQTAELGYYGDLEAERLALRRSIDYSSSSSGSPSPTKTGFDFHKQYGYQVTYNEAYKSGDEEEAPPSLPPRNYSPADSKSGKTPALPSAPTQSPSSGHDQQPPSDTENANKSTRTEGQANNRGLRSNKTTPEQAKPPKIMQMELQPGVQETDLDQVLKLKRQQQFNNVENTPKESNYADQLRQQSRRISQSQQPMLNAARYQSKPIFEPKVSISTSQPVKKQPTPQEAHPAPPGDRFANNKSEGFNEVAKPLEHKVSVMSVQAVPQSVQVTQASLQTLSAPQTQAAKLRRHSHHQYQQSAPSIKEEKSRRISHHLLSRPDFGEKSKHSSSTLLQSDFAKSRALSVGSQDLTRTAISESSEASKAEEISDVSARQKNNAAESMDTSLEDNVYEDMSLGSHDRSHDKLQPQASPRSHDHSQASSPELPLPPPPKELHTRMEFSPHSTPLPPPPPSGQFENQSGHHEEPMRESRKRLIMKDTNELSPYSKDSYMHFKSQNQANRRVYGSYQRKSDTPVTSPPTSPTLSPSTLSLQHSDGKTSGSANDIKTDSVTSQRGAQIPSPEPRESGPDHVHATVNAGAGPSKSAEKSASSVKNNYVRNNYQNRVSPVDSGSSSKSSSLLGDKVKFQSHSDNMGSESPGSYHMRKANATSSFPYKHFNETNNSQTSVKVADIKANLLRRSNENLVETIGRKSPVNLESHLIHSKENLKSPLDLSHENAGSPVRQSPVNNAFIPSKSDSHARYGSTDSSRSDPSFDRMDRTKNGADNKKKNVSDPMMGSGHTPTLVSGDQAKSKAMKEDLNNIKSQSDFEIPVPCHHKRQKSQEEIEYEEHAAILASKLKDEDRALSEVIHPPAEMKSSTDYMDDLFISDSSPSRSPQHKSNDSLYSSDLRNQISPKSSWTSKNELNSDLSSLTRQKEELINRLKKKLEILQEERETLQEEIKDNNDLGKKLGQVLEQKSNNASHVEKFQLLVDELDKVLHLLLMLSGRLAKEENAVLCLPPATDPKTKDLRVSKCEELRGKLNDAKSLKEGIDRRSDTVAKFLPTYLNGDEMSDYQHFVKMKTKLKMDLQEIDDKIVMGKDQLAALEKSISSS